MSDASPPEGRAPSRASRSAAMERRWRIQLVVIAVLTALAVLFVAMRSTGGDGAPPAPTTPAASPAVVAGASQLLALSISGAPTGLVATVGTGGGRPSAAVVIPSQLTLVMPGAGEMTTEDLQNLPADAMRTGVSNVDGAWNEHYAAIELERFGQIVDRLGGLTPDLADVYTSGAQVFGPGPTHLTGAQVVALLRANADDTAMRWSNVLAAFLAARPNLSPTDLADSDDPQAAAAILGSGAARIELVPTQVVGGSTLIPAQPDFDALMTELFDTTAPLRAEVRNGSGEPGVGASVGAQLIPAGFRIVLSENADTFDYQTTQVIADGPDNEAAATTAKDALGVGKITTSSIPSGLTDITVIVGKDYHA